MTSRGEGHRRDERPAAGLGIGRTRIVAVSILVECGVARWACCDARVEYRDRVVDWFAISVIGVADDEGL